MSQSVRRDLDCCCQEVPFTPRERICTDPDGRTRTFRQVCRDCFWPVFTHPRWLRCRVLYCCCHRDPCRSGR